MTATKTILDIVQKREARDHQDLLFLEALRELDIMGLAMEGPLRKSDIKDLKELMELINILEERAA